MFKKYVRHIFKQLMHNTILNFVAEHGHLASSVKPPDLKYLALYFSPVSRPIKKPVHIIS